ncbi:TPA: hypothetical protein HA246_01600 [Candidatus Woesearchaeota archaeon]|nr:hypothetical protein [Candidatus Woesearchaeota archaeon]
MKEFESLPVKVAGEDHTLTVGKINYASQLSLNYVELTLRSDPISVKVFTGETIKIDFQKDGKDDLSITIVEVTSDSVVLKLVDLITGRISITDAFNLFEKTKSIDISKATACVNVSKKEIVGAEKTKTETSKEEKESTEKGVTTEKSALGKDEKLELKNGQSVAVEPFKVNCKSGSTVDLQLVVPVNYVDLEALRCKQGICSPVVVKSLSQLECGDVILDKTRTEQYLKPKIETLNITKVELKLDMPARSLETGGNKLTLLSKNIPKDLSLSLDVFREEIKQPENNNLKIVSYPLAIAVKGIAKEKLVSLTQKLSVQIEVPLISDPEVDPNSILLYAKTKDDWQLLDGAQVKGISDEITTDETDNVKNKVKATIDDISKFTDENNQVVVALIGLICRNCERTSFENIYLPPEGSVAAVIMVHGLGSSPATFNDIINDIRFTKQPWQAWTFAYPSSKTTVENGKELADNLQKNEKLFENIYIIGHSLGGIVTQRALSYAAEENNKDATKYTFIKKVKKAIIVGSPNDKVAGSDAFKLLFKYMVNVKTGSSLFDVNSAAVKELAEQKNIPKVSGIDYFVIAGTKPYELNTALFTIRTDKIFGLSETNDGIVTITSAQRIGGEYINDRCKNYWEIPETHTALIDNEQSRIIIEKLIAREIEKDIKSREVSVSSQYIQLQIPECSSDDKYVVVGKAVKKEKVEDKTGCSCGNGYCGAGEDQITCPTDCAKFFREENLCKPAIAATALFGLIALAVISILIYYGVQQESLQRRLRKALFWLEILFILLFAFNLLTCGIKAGIFLIEVFAIIVLFIYMYKHKKALGILGDLTITRAAGETTGAALTTIDQAELPVDNDVDNTLKKQEEKREQEILAKQQAVEAKQQKNMEKEEARQQAILAKQQETLAKQQELLAKQQKKQFSKEQMQLLIQKRQEFNKQKKKFAFIQKQKDLKEMQLKALKKYNEENKREKLETPATFAYRLLSMVVTPFNKYDHHLDWIYDVLEKAYVAYNSGKKEEAKKFYVRAAEIYKLLPFDKKIKVYYALRKLRDLLY